MTAIATATLSRREREVCVMVLLGSTAIEAGARLSIGARTVEYHREKACRKLGVAGIRALASKLYEVAA